MPIGETELRQFRETLERYRSAKRFTENRILSTENWWKLRNAQEEKANADGVFTAQSAWLHNVIMSKHADAMASFPEPNILPREAGDVQQAQMLSSVIPCILEQNGFEEVYDGVQWAKMKSGTGCYKVYWDQSLHGGLGDIRVEQISLLNVYWEPGVADIQKSRYFFQTELWDRETLENTYPELKDRGFGDSSRQARFRGDERDAREDKIAVVEVYYHRMQHGRRILHYCKFVEDVILYATENQTESIPDAQGNPTRLPLSETGLYDHGRYPFEFDVLFPIEGSPCGYGYVDIGKNPQTKIDLMDTAMVKNVVVNAMPRFFSQQDGNFNEQELLDLTAPIVHVEGRVDETSLRQIVTTPLPANAVNMLNRAVQELRETSGNTDTSNGTVSGGVTAASAIAALQEASGKGSRDSNRGAYRCFRRVVELCIELVRQFYDLPRKFRILGDYGVREYVSYSNSGIRPQPQLDALGIPLGLRTPVFDVRVSAQRANIYTKVSQNELALQFFRLGFFNPQLSAQAMLCLEMMDFEGKDRIMQAIVKNNSRDAQLEKYMRLALTQAAGPESRNMILQDWNRLFGAKTIPTAAQPSLGQASRIEQARQRARSVTDPYEGGQA